jgi:hypothetical protein
MTGRIIVSVFSLLMAHIGISQDITLMHKEGTMAGTLLNPAFNLDKTLNFSAGAFHTEFITDGPSLSQITSENSDGTRFLDRNKFDAGFETQNNIFTQLEFRTLDAGVRLGSWAFLAGHGFKTQAQLAYSKDLAQLLFLGNAPFVGQQLDIGPSLNVMAYNEVYLGLQKTAGKWSLGGKIKLLYGTANAYTEKSEVTFTTDEEYYRWEFENDVTVRSSGTIRYNRLDSINFTLPEVTLDNFFYNNRGWAADVGLVYKPGDRLTISASALDIGYITWDFFPRKFQSRGSFSFDGFDLFDLTENTEMAFRDSLNQLFEVSQSLEEYTTMLNSTFNLGATYQLNHWTYNGLYQWRQYFGTPQHTLSVSAVRKIYFADLGVQMSIRKNDFVNIGLYSNVNLRYISIYAAVHNVVHGLDWTQSRSFFLRLGTTMQF